MKENHESRTVEFELQERIPLGESIADVSSIQNVEIVPEVEMISDHASYRLKGFLKFTAVYEGRAYEAKSQETQDRKIRIFDDEEPLQPFLLEKGAYHNKRAKKEILHRIPIDVTLPADRVDEEGLVLEITSLDYDLVQANTLLVQVKLSLSGILEEELVRPIYALDNQPNDDVRVDTQVVETNAYWDKGSDLYYEKESLEFFPSEKEQNQEENRVEDSGESPLIDQQDELDDRKDDAITEEKLLETLPEEEEDREYDSIQEEEVNVDVLQESDPEREVKVSITNRLSKLMDTRTKRAEKTEEETAQEMDRSKTVRLLSQFLSSREDTFTKIKVCLVQPGETLEEIALRYSLTPQDILSFNQLDEGSYLGGKVLRIPVKKAK